MVPLAIILAAVLGALVVVIGAELIGQSVWLVLSAIGTSGAVIWAIFHQAFLTWWKKVPALSPLGSEFPSSGGYYLPFR